MKVLTLWQPWASLIALGVKTIETRSWSTQYRGPLAIHAAARPFKGGRVGEFVGVKDADYTADTPPFLVRWPVLRPLDPAEPWRWVPLGAIVATCTLVDVVPIIDNPKVMDESFVTDHKGRLSAFHGLAHHRDWPAAWGGGTGAYAWHVEDQRPYGDFTAGRFAWLLSDVKPVDPPVPFKGGQGLARSWEPSDG